MGPSFWTPFWGPLSGSHFGSLNLAGNFPRKRGIEGWIDHQEQRVDQNVPEADRRNVPEEVISVSDGEVDRESTIGGCSSQASCSTTSSDEDSEEPARSEVSVQDSMMERRNLGCADDKSVPLPKLSLFELQLVLMTLSHF